MIDNTQLLRTLQHENIVITCKMNTKDTLEPMKNSWAIEGNVVSNVTDEYDGMKNKPKPK